MRRTTRDERREPEHHTPKRFPVRPSSFPSAPVNSLTEREKEVLSLIGAGLNNREISDRLVVTLNTVKKHTSNIYSKLGVGSRTQAIALARDLGLL